MLLGRAYEVAHTTFDIARRLEDVAHESVADRGVRVVLFLCSSCCMLGKDSLSKTIFSRAGLFLVVEGVSWTIGMCGNLRL